MFKTQYHPVTVKLTNNQKLQLYRALVSKTGVSIRLSYNAITDGNSDVAYVTQTQKNKIDKAKKNKKGIVLKISKTQLKSFIRYGSGLFQ